MTAMKYHRAFQIMERYVLGNWSEMIQWIDSWAICVCT
jgi:hypothetical protein